MTFVMGKRIPQKIHAPQRDALAVDVLRITMTCVDFSDEIARRAVELSKELHLTPPDAIVLASAEVNGCILVTRNTKDLSLTDSRVVPLASFDYSYAIRMRSIRQLPLPAKL